MNNHVPSISPELLLHRLRQDETLQLVDLRPGQDYQREHLLGSVSAPLTGNLDRDFADRFRRLGLQARRTIFLLANSREDAVTAGEWMQRTRGGRAVVVDGDLDSWRSAGLLTQTQDSILESLSQPRAVIGTSLIFCALMGYLVSPLFLLIVAAIGCGLILPTDSLTRLFQKQERADAPRTSSQVPLHKSDCPSR